MLISPSTERVLVNLAHRGMWIALRGDRLQVIETREPSASLTDSLRLQIAQNRAELIEVIPEMNADNLALTGPVVRVLFAQLDPECQARPVMAQSDFSKQYDDLTISERVAFLWWYMDGPIAERNRREERVSA